MRALSRNAAVGCSRPLVKQAWRSAQRGHRAGPQKGGERGRRWPGAAPAPTATMVANECHGCRTSDQRGGGSNSSGCGGSGSSTTSVTTRLVEAAHTAAAPWRGWVSHDACHHSNTVWARRAALGGAAATAEVATPMGSNGRGNKNGRKEVATSDVAIPSSCHSLPRIHQQRSERPVAERGGRREGTMVGRW